MFSKYHDVEYIDTVKFTHFAMPTKHRNITLDSPAIKIMMDFNKLPPATIDHAVCVDDAKALMELASIRLQFVTRNSVYLGLVTLRYLQSRKVMVKMQKLGLERSELTVEQVMLPKDRIHALCYQSVKNARIGDILHTLQSLHESYVLVVENDEQDADIVGLISAADVASYLDIPIELFQPEKTFLSLVQIIRGRSA